MTKLFMVVCIVVALAVAGGSSAPLQASRNLRPTVEETAAAPCPMHSSLSGSLDTGSGSLQESGTMAIGNTVFNVVDPSESNTITIDGKLYKTSDITRGNAKTYSIST
ncbi:hypothetical protein PHYSODRAFT_299235 [Phytophthora sojae]|uniref:Pectate lyase n=1 Tax=Phytophthora sojae (strain P6497) TaxID=1094619 RepID=G4Z400_PHYSP|nr:hypothetical protein PHYSODRAFT_299235 [Phytophthora sojae]EGZ21552.1 hypothetical protein PHYSODRAFT_299235 [Phytophthora sojae]|eukprot:XP_009524269.1 hypothetical protein PHYSODRAFT_299235 [Phytophthora sojae]